MGAHSEVPIALGVNIEPTALPATALRGVDAGTYFDIWCIVEVGAYHSLKGTDVDLVAD